jgi:hypothetical protein
MLFMSVNWKLSALALLLSGALIAVSLSVLKAEQSRLSVRNDIAARLLEASTVPPGDDANPAVMIALAKSFFDTVPRNANVAREAWVLELYRNTVARLVAVSPPALDASVRAEIEQYRELKTRLDRR